MYAVRHSGDIKTTDYRAFIEKDGAVVSPMHDVPLFADEEKKIFNMVVEIPRGTNAKMEMCLSEAGNPLKQDVKNGALRFVHNIFPYTGYMWNYGAFPQTWENPHHVHPETQAKGDNDPLDVCDIGSQVGFRGEIKQVKVLGTLALIDEGETDWKVIVIDVNDPRAAEFNDIDDVNRIYPGFVMATYEWFRTYKIPAGKPANEFAFNGEAKNREYALAVIEENHNFWKGLQSGEIQGKVVTDNVTQATNKIEKFNIEFKEFVDADISPEPLKAPEDAVARDVAMTQREHPHSVAELSSAIAIIAANLGKDNFAEAVTAGNDISEVVQGDNVTKNGDGPFTVVVPSCGKGFGLFYKKTPHSISFPGSEELEQDIHAAGFISDSGFTYTSGYGLRTFANGERQNGNPEIPSSSDATGRSAAALAFIKAFA